MRDTCTWKNYKMQVNTLFVLHMVQLKTIAYCLFLNIISPMFLFELHTVKIIKLDNWQLPKLSKCVLWVVKIIPKTVKSFALTWCSLSSTNMTAQMHISPDRLQCPNQKRTESQISETRTHFHAQNCTHYCLHLDYVHIFLPFYPVSTIRI